MTASQQKKDALDGCALSGDTRYCSAISSDFLEKRKLNALVADIGFAVAGAAAIALITVIALEHRWRNPVISVLGGMSLYIAGQSLLALP